MKRKFTISVSLMCIVALTALAGYVHLPGSRTRWVDVGTEATCWGASKHAPYNIYPVARPQIFEDTIKYLDIDSTNSCYGTGLWEYDSSGDYQPIAVTQEMYDRRMDLGVKAGTEWEVTSNANITVKS